MIVILSFYILLAVGLVAFALWGVMVWSYFWPREKFELLSFDSVEVSINGRHGYKAIVRYKYNSADVDYHSERFSLFGSRLFKDKGKIVQLVNSDFVYVCPVVRSYSFIWRDPRAIWGFGLSSVISFMIALALS